MARVDSVHFDIPPFATRVRHVLALALALVAIALAMKLGWFTATNDGGSVTIELGRVRDMPALSIANGAAYYLLLIVTFFAGVYFFIRAAYMGVTVLIGNPLVKRGLFRSKLQVAWMSPRGAHIHTAILLGLAIVLVAWKPTLEMARLHAPVAADISYDLGGFVLIAGLLLVHLSIYLIARNPDIAESQMWNRELAPAPAAPAPRERPMVKSPLPPPPKVDGDPFRGPPAGELATRLVKTAAPPSAAPLAEDPTAEKPRLLT